MIVCFCFFVCFWFPFLEGIWPSIPGCAQTHSPASALQVPTYRFHNQDRASVPPGSNYRVLPGQLLLFSAHPAETHPLFFQLYLQWVLSILEHSVSRVRECGLCLTLSSEHDFLCSSPMLPQGQELLPAVLFSAHWYSIILYSDFSPVNVSLIDGIAMLFSQLGCSTYF